MFHLNFSYYNHKEMKLNIYYGWVGEKGGTTKQAQEYIAYIVVTKLKTISMTKQFNFVAQLYLFKLNT